MKTKKHGTKCTKKTSKHKRVFRCRGDAKKTYDIDFSGGDITSDGGAIFLRQADNNIELSKKISSVIIDPRAEKNCDHSLLNLVKQRLYTLALGYEDLNDHKDLREDKYIQSLLGKDTVLASASTLSRFEKYSDRKTMLELHKILLEQFLSAHKVPPKEIILDFDATDDETHGEQEGSHFNGYYDHHCFLPLYVFCEDFPLVAYLRPSNIDGAKHAWAILALLVKNIRKKWPDTKIIFRGDSGFCRHKMLGWCENNSVGYLCGIGTNRRLANISEDFTAKAKEYFDHTLEKQRIFTDFEYGAKTWSKERRIILKAEHLAKGANPRFLVTNLEGDPQYLYEQIYCARGDMENRIKEQQLGLFADRTSCHKWWPNQFRLLMSTMAYVLIGYIRRIALANTQLAKAQVTTIRLKLFKIGAAIISNTRRIRVLLSSVFPMKNLFFDALAKLTPS